MQKGSKHRKTVYRMGPSKEWARPQPVASPPPYLHNNHLRKTAVAGGGRASPAQGRLQHVCNILSGIKQSHRIIEIN